MKDRQTDNKSKQSHWMRRLSRNGSLPPQEKTPVGTPQEKAPVGTPQEKTSVNPALSREIANHQSQPVPSRSNRGRWVRRSRRPSICKCGKTEDIGKCSTCRRWTCIGCRRIGSCHTKKFSHGYHGQPYSGSKSFTSASSWGGNGTN